MTGTDLPDFSRKEKRLLRRLPAGRAVSDFLFFHRDCSKGILFAGGTVSIFMPFLQFHGSLAQLVEASGC